MDIINFDFTKNLSEDRIVTDLWNYLEKKNYHVTKSFMNSLEDVGFFDKFFDIVNREYDLSYPNISLKIDIEYCLNEFKYDWSNRYILSKVEDIFSSLEIDYDMLIENVDGNMISDCYDSYELVDYLARNHFNKKQINYIKEAFEDYTEVLTENIVEYGNPDTLPQYYNRDMFTVDVVPYKSDIPLQIAFDVRSMTNIYEYVKSCK